MSRKVQHTDVVYSVIFHPDSFCSTVLKLSPRKQVFDIYFSSRLCTVVFFNDKKPVSSQLAFKVYVVHSLKCT